MNSVRQTHNILGNVDVNEGTASVAVVAVVTSVVTVVNGGIIETWLTNCILKEQKFIYIHYIQKHKSTELSSIHNPVNGDYESVAFPWQSK